LIEEGISRNPGLNEVYIKLIVTGGVSADGISPTTPSVIMLFLAASERNAKLYTEGIKLKKINYVRYLPKAKSLNYMSGVISLQQSKAEGGDEILYVNPNGHLLEGATANFYAVMNGEIHTAEEDVLDGITRKFIFQKCDSVGQKLVIGNLKESDIPKFEEAFISSTTREIMPVVRIDDQVIGSVKVGVVTKRLMDEFAKAARG